MSSPGLFGRPKSETPPYQQSNSQLFCSPLASATPVPGLPTTFPTINHSTNQPTECNNVTSALDVLTLDMRDLVRKVQHLSHLGIEDNRIALPKICVVGDQSAGKSSLIESISEIKVPRSAGTCTRCPMEIVLRESEPDQKWKCVISLVYTYYYDPQKQYKHRIPKIEKPEYLGPWLRKSVQEEEQFIILTDKGLLQDAIWWAQLAILNPRSDSQEYVPGKNIETPETRGVEFSPNVVRLDISGPNLPNLSFYDLPGVINQAQKEEEKYVVTLVSKLAKLYVSQQNCIVLLTQSMTDDASNSTAARIVRDVKGATERTLGVLTKPDRMARDNDSYREWEEILEGKKFLFGHGYYVVKNTTDPQIDHAAAREEEERFFGLPFWSGNMASYQDRFGVRKLQQALSAILMAQIQKSLPSIIKQIDEKARRIDVELRTLPDPPVENFQFILIKKVVKLGLCFNGLFGDGSENKLLQKPWNDLVLDFHKALDKTRPRIGLSDKSDLRYFTEAMDSECELIPGPSPRGAKRKSQHPEANMKPDSAQLGQLDENSYITEYFKEWQQGRRFELEEIRKLKQECQLAGIPNQIDPRAIQKLNQLSVEHWDGIVRTFVTAMHSILQQVVSKTLNDVMSNYHQTGLFRELQKITTEFLSRVRADYANQVLHYFCMEHEVPFTMAHEEHKQKSNKALGELVQKRNIARRRAWMKVRGYPEDNKDSNLNLGPDPFSQEMEMLASSRGYYEIAKMRFTDMVCILAEFTIRRRCRNELKETLEKRLNAMSPERCCELMAEDPEREARRNDLTKQRENLARAQGWLATVHNADEDEMQTTSDRTMDNVAEMNGWTETYA